MKKDIQIEYKNDKTTYRVNGSRRSFCLTGSPFDNSWARHDEEYLRLTDSGNGITVQFSDSQEPLELNYMQAELIRLALKINDSGKAKISEILVKKFEGLTE